MAGQPVQEEQVIATNNHADANHITMSADADTECQWRYWVLMLILADFVANMIGVLIFYDGQFRLEEC